MDAPSKHILRLVVALLVVSSFSESGRAQRANQGTGAELEQDVATLKKDVNVLAREQRQIINQLEELKRLFPTNPASLPTPKPVPLPSALAFHEERFRGQAGATIAFIEYADFECPYCAQYERDVYPQLSADYVETGKVKYFYRDMPLEMHPHAMTAARAARCAGEQSKYWEMHDSLFARQNLLRQADMPGRAKELGLDQAKFAECISSDKYTTEVNQSALEAHKLGINGTPTFFIGKIDADGKTMHVGKVIIGARPYEEFKSAIDTLLAAK